MWTLGGECLGYPKANMGEESQETGQIGNLCNLLGTENIKHSLTPTYIIINSHTKSLFTSVCFTQYKHFFQQKKPT